MRRLIAAVALIVTLWPNIAVMRCAGPAPSADSYTSSVMPDHQHGGPDCPALMACTAAMIESVGVAVPVEGSGPGVQPVRQRALPPAVTVLTEEPPPPRRSV